MFFYRGFWKSFWYIHHRRRLSLYSWELPNSAPPPPEPKNSKKDHHLPSVTRQAPSLFKISKRVTWTHSTFNALPWMATHTGNGRGEGAEPSLQHDNHSHAKTHSSSELLRQIWCVVANAEVDEDELTRTWTAPMANNVTSTLMAAYVLVSIRCGDIKAGSKEWDPWDPASPT